MDYKLCKKLKDAGFSDKRYIGSKHYHFISHPRMGIPVQHAINTQIEEFPSHPAYKDDNDWVYIPTLSELIEACGVPFGIDCNVKGYWYARQAMHSESITTDFHSTPEEAVANLWLKIKEFKK